MNFCFLSPHFPPNYVHFASHLSRLGAKVYGVADVSWDSLDARLKESLAAYYRVKDMEVYDQLVRAVGYITFKAGKVDHHRLLRPGGLGGRHAAGRHRAGAYPGS